MTTVPFRTKIYNFANYYPFGMQHTGTEGSYDLTTDYRYGYNGKEKDDEIKGEANSLDYGARIYDPRVGKFLSVDPMASHFPDWSPYIYAYDNPITLIDENGEFGDDARGKFYKTMGVAAMKAISSMDVSANKFKALYILAQYRMENGFNLNSPGNNPFNIKGKGDAGQITYLTTEYIKGKPVKMQQNFAKFSSLQDGFTGYLNLLKTNFSKASAALTENSMTVEDFANGLMNGKKGAYATNPTYATELKNMLKGVVKDYENDINNQLKQNSNLILRNNEIINSKTTTDDEKSDAKTNNSQINISNQQLNNDLQKLKEFKKNEGLDK